MYRLIVTISLGLALIQAPKLAGDQKASPPTTAQEVTGSVHTYDQVGPVCSPDGRWLAYISDETGTTEVYVQAFPGNGGKWQVSAKSGTTAMGRSRSSGRSSCSTEAK